MGPVVADERPDGATRAAVLRLAELIEREDGAPPLSDQTRSLLRSEQVRHLVARDGDEVVGYGQLAQQSGGPQALEIASRTDAAGPILDAAGGPSLVWSHGRRSRLITIFEQRAFARVRELFQLRRPAGPALPPDPPVPADVSVRTFEPGRDEPAWLAVNAAAFAGHAEQGRMTRADLEARETESWFDPAGFLLAERAGELLGFHWTKVHPDGLGEVYVLGVSPQAQGLGLGDALLVRGLRYLYLRACPEILLYVDADNPHAVRLYERREFTHFDIDIQWETPAKADIDREFGVN